MRADIEIADDLTMRTDELALGCTIGRRRNQQLLVFSQAAGRLHFAAG
jgi:hypothetical protein